MYVVDVVPFSPSAPGSSLSYRSRKSHVPGDLVTVTLRRRSVPAVVVGVREVRDAKAELKAASFALSGTLESSGASVPAPLYEAVRRTALWHAAPIGAVLHTLLEPWVEVGLSPAKEGTFSVDSMESPLGVRRALYRSHIDACRTAGKATAFIVSTLAEVEYWKRALADFDPVVLSGALTESKRTDALTKATEADLVIATPTFSFVQNDRLGQVIVERAGAGGFRFPKRPYLDVRVALTERARAHGLTLVQGDYPLPLELRAGTQRLSTPEGRIQVIDTRTTKDESWAAVPEALHERIRAALSTGGRVAVIAARKGYAPSVVCRDCGHALKDERGKAYAFHTVKGARVFRTADGKSVLGTDMTCPNCDSWNLMPLGVGAERVVEGLATAYAEHAVINFDSDTVRTAQGARRRLALLKEIPGIVVGTEAMVPWLLAASPAPITLATIASADSLLALPFWRARERFLRLAFLLESLAPDAVVGTRLPDDAAVRTLADPKDAAFFEEETALRKALEYPPFGTLISLSWQGGPSALDTLAGAVRKAVLPYVPKELPDKVVRGGMQERTFVLTLPPDSWPDVSLSASLAALPPSVRVMLDPESFW